MNAQDQDEIRGMHAVVRQIGDGWTLMIIWSALNGITRFEEFHRRLRIARNILSSRLTRLVDAGVLEKRPVSPGARRLEYRPTARAEALRPMFEDVMLWQRTWSRRRVPAGDAAAARRAEART